MSLVIQAVASNCGFVWVSLDIHTYCMSGAGANYSSTPTLTGCVHNSFVPVPWFMTSSWKEAQHQSGVTWKPGCVCVCVLVCPFQHKKRHTTQPLILVITAKDKMCFSKYTQLSAGGRVQSLQVRTEQEKEQVLNKYSSTHQPQDLVCVHTDRTELSGETFFSSIQENMCN